MKNKGFTLLELICALVLLSLVLIIAIPSIMYKVNDQRDKISDLTQKIIFNATNLYTEDYKTISDLNDGSNYCITLDTLVQEGYLKAPLKDAKTGKEIPLNKYVRGTINQFGDLDDLKIVDECSLKPGLYDDNDNLVASWDELVNTYNFHPENHYSYAEAETTSGSYVYMVTNNANLQSGTKLIIDSSVTTIGWYAFKNSSLKKIVISEGTKWISGSAFWRCTELVSIILPSTVEDLGSEAFAGDAKLTKIELPANLRNINSYTFSGCTGLTSITIPSNVKYIGNRAFENCTNLSNVIFDNQAGWFVTTNYDAQSGDTVTLTDQSANATYLKETYINHFWRNN